MSFLQLRTQWTRTFKVPAPPEWTPDLMRHAIAYEWQERVMGTISHDDLRMINRLVAEIEAEGSVDAKRPPSGTRFVRAWGGESHHVVMTDRGYEYRGENYTSLTAVAQKITGRHRSGPLFFGLRERP